MMYVLSVGEQGQQELLRSTGKPERLREERERAPLSHEAWKERKLEII